MKFILPFFIALFISACTFNSPDTPEEKPSANSTTNQTQNNNESIFITEPVSEEENKSEHKSNEQKAEDENEEKHIFTSLNSTIVEIAGQLFDTKLDKKNNIRVILTTFVDLDTLESTSSFGRLISESMFNELHIRKFLVTDFRGQNAVTVNEDGEFHITRDADKLKDNVGAVEFILVGTYVKFENESLLINARIIDSISGKILSTSRVVYHPKDCSLYEVCNKDKEDLMLDKAVIQKVVKKAEEKSQKQVINMKARDVNNFSIIADCEGEECPK